MNLREKKKGQKTLDTVYKGWAQNNNANRFLFINYKVNGISNNIIIESRESTFFKNFFLSKLGFKIKLNIVKLNLALQPLLLDEILIELK